MVVVLLYTKPPDAFPAAARSSMRLGDKYKKIYFPPPLDYSLDALKVYNEDYYEAAIYVLCELIAEIPGDDEKMMREGIKAANSVFKTALVKPNFQDIEHGFTVTFDVWSLYQNKYVDIAELDEFETEMVQYMLLEMFNAN